jgi:hypothetical protein
MAILLAAIGGLSAGLLHVLSGPDHLAAVAPLALERRRGWWRPGLLWGLGHGGGVALVGVLLVAMRDLLPLEALSSWSERVVGLALVALGVWALTRAARLAVPSVEPEQAQPPGAAPLSDGAAAAMGTLHGLAGGSHLLGVLPALALGSSAASVGYLSGFGVGGIVAMAGFSSLVGHGARRFGGPATAVQRRLMQACATVALIVGAVWLAT